MNKLPLTPWESQSRNETVSKACASAIYAAMALAEQSNSPDLADALLPIHHEAIKRFQQIEATATV